MLYGAQVAVLFSDKNKTHKYSVGWKYNAWMLNLLMHYITSWPLKGTSNRREFYFWGLIKNKK